MNWLEITTPEIEVVVNLDNALTITDHEGRTLITYADGRHTCVDVEFGVFVRAMNANNIIIRSVEFGSVEK